MSFEAQKFLILMKSSLSVKSFIVLALTFRSVIHFELIFVYGVKKGSKFKLLHLDMCSSQRRLFLFFVFLGIYLFGCIGS